MAYITLKDGRRLWVQCGRYDLTIDQLVAQISSGYNSQSIEAMRILSELGPLALEAAPLLDTALLTCYD